MFPNTYHATLKGKPIRDQFKHEMEWLDQTFITKVQKRGGEIISVSGKSSSASAANAICDHVRELWNGTPEGNTSSMAVISDGNPYGIAEDLFFSFPCTIKKGGQYEIVKGLNLNDFEKSKIKETESELQMEKSLAIKVI